MIEYENVGVEVEGYDLEGKATTTTILSDISLTLSQQRIAVIGANGSGKSTLLKLVNGLVKATSGSVRVNGKDPAHDARAVRRQVGHVFTDPMAQLIMATPVEEVELSLRSAIKNRQKRHEKALQILRERGLEKVVNRSVHALSGGERQMVALASVLAVEPSIVIADEPTTLLDLGNRLQLTEIFAALDQQLIVSTHDLDLASQMERVLLISGGHLIADGKPDVVIAQYRDMMTSRFKAK